MALLAELRRRNVIRMAGLYLVGAWLLVQVAGTLLPVFEAPAWVMKTVVGLLAVGFVLALIFSWVFELTPEGLKRDAEVPAGESIAPQTARRMDRTIIAVLALALAYFAFDKFVLGPRREAATAAVVGADAGAGKGAAIGRQSVAVLPFENLSRDPDNAYFVEGIQDEILTRLAGISALKVISRTSTMRYASRPGDLKEIARQLGVANLVEGSVQRAGGSVRVNVQLIEADSDSHLWAQSFDREVQNIFAVESEVAQRVADALRATLLPAESARIASVPTKNPEAYDRFLKAEYLQNQSELSTLRDTNDATRRAEALYEGAIAADPSFALAHAQLAFLIMDMYWRSVDTAPERLDQARASAMRALELEPNLPQAHLALGYFHYWGHKDYPAALAEFAAARASLPNDAKTAKAIAYVYRRQGRVADSVPELERAIALDPRDATSFLNQAMTLGFLRRYGEAEAALNRALALSPNSIESRVYLAFMLINDDRPADAEAALAVAPPDADPRGFVSHVRYDLAMFRRQPDAALAALARAPARLDDFVGNELIALAVLRGQALAAKGDGGAARAAFEEARLALEADRRTARERSEIESQLAVAYAGLGRKPEALETGRHALSLRPYEQDALAATTNLYRMAQVETMVGETQPAIDHLEQLMALPAGLTLSAATLRNAQTWDPLRRESRFTALIAKADASAAAMRSKAAASGSSAEAPVIPRTGPN